MKSTNKELIQQIKDKLPDHIEFGLSSYATSTVAMVLYDKKYKHLPFMVRPWYFKCWNIDKRCLGYRMMNSKHPSHFRERLLECLNYIELDDAFCEGDSSQEDDKLNLELSRSMY